MTPWPLMRLAGTPSRHGSDVVTLQTRSRTSSDHMKEGDVIRKKERGCRVTNLVLNNLLVTWNYERWLWCDAHNLKSIKPCCRPDGPLCRPAKLRIKIGKVFATRVKSPSSVSHMQQPVQFSCGAFLCKILCDRATRLQRRANEVTIILIYFREEMAS